jgi:hypothetical protein
VHHMWPAHMYVFFACSRTLEMKYINEVVFFINF